MYSQRPWMPGISTSEFSVLGSTFSVSKRFPCFQRVLNAFERLALAAQLQERFALEVQQVRLVDRRLVGQCPAGDDVGERTADDRVVVADTASAPREMDPELERRENA